MELLAPAGNFEKLRVALLYGADAVYCAGPEFGLRSGADNFSDHELAKAVAYTHEQGRKVYVTLNAFLHDADLVRLPEFVRFLEEIAVDAVIVSDLGVMSVIQEHSRIPIHLSTQASCLNSWSARFWKQMGATRLILGREVSIAEAETIRREVDIEVELFIHGAMCSAYSGHCVISNYTAGRDSNRGGCVQSCRMPYEVVSEDGIASHQPPATGNQPPATSHQPPATDISPAQTLMSSKDLRGIRLLPKFLESGIASAKIEGRMKGPLYAATTVRTYAEALRWVRTQPPETWLERLAALSEDLKQLPHRGYTEASLEQPAGADSLQLESGQQGEAELAGVVLEVRPEKSLMVLARNVFETETPLQLLPVAGKPVTLSTPQMRDSTGRPLQRATPHRLVTFPWVPGALPWTVVRMPRREPSQQQAV